MARDTFNALLFDVFGTVVDWRSSVIRDGEVFGAKRGLDLDWAGFADDWRREYMPSLNRVRSGELPFMRLDALHRMSLEKILRDRGITNLEEADLDWLNRVWHRLDPWPDSVAGLTRLKSRYILGTLSNGHVALMVNMAKRAGLSWDVILGAEVARHYKPDPEVYLTAADWLGLAPWECLMVAAHPQDLEAARDAGLGTAFVYRPHEYGDREVPRPGPERGFDIFAEDLVDLARKLDC